MTRTLVVIGPCDNSRVQAERFGFIEGLGIGLAGEGLGVSSR
jgi:hypothetical protein